MQEGATEARRASGLPKEARSPRGIVGPFESLPARSLRMWEALRAEDVSCGVSMVV